MKFFRNLVASILGFFISIFLIFIFFALIAALVSSPEKIIVKPNSVLALDLSSEMKDYIAKGENPIEKALGIEDKRLSLEQVINAIENAKTDENIEGISIYSPAVSGGMAQTQEIRNKLKEFKESGKFVYAYNDQYDQKSYYLSSVADSVFVNPYGMVDFRGLTREILYYKDFEDKYGVKMEVIRHGKYKSAVEPYLFNKMSDANREQILSYMTSIWQQVKEDVGVARSISGDTLTLIADESLGRNATLAKENKLVDAVVYQDQYEDKLLQVVGGDSHLVSIQDYISSGKGRLRSTAKNKIAVIYAEGEIMYGEGDENVIGNESMSKTIQKIKKDKRIKAVVLRVNSPGGSALASELIWRELSLLKQEKPLVVSMGNVAASGGYYIACNANSIVAEPTTITGSIGVFGVLPNINKLAERIGINAEQVSTNKGASYSPFEPMSKKFYDVTKEGVEQVYETFVNRVSQGRGLPYETAESVAQGRVWTGAEAQEKGLVDALGTLEDAICIAANLAELSTYKIRNYPNYEVDLEDVFNLSNLPFSINSKETILKEYLGEEGFRVYGLLNSIKKMKGIQARIPYELEIK